MKHLARFSIFSLGFVFVCVLFGPPANAQFDAFNTAGGPGLSQAIYPAPRPAPAGGFDAFHSGTPADTGVWADLPEEPDGDECVITGVQTNCTVLMDAPELQGATNGTIGPQAGDATVIHGVNTGAIGITFNEILQDDPRGITDPVQYEDYVFSLLKADISKTSEQIGLDGASAELLLKRGVAYGNLGEHYKAIKDLSDAIELGKHSHRAYYNLGTVYSNLEMYDYAMLYYNKALAIKPSARACFHRGLVNSIRGQEVKAVADFNQSARLSAPTPDVLFFRGYSRFKLGQVPQAVDDFGGVIRAKAPYYLGPSYYWRGVCRTKMELYEVALADFDIALKMDDQPVYFNERGKVFLKLKEHDAALYDFNEALHRDPALAEAYDNRGKVYLAIGRKGPAIDDMLMAARLSR